MNKQLLIVLGLGALVAPWLGGSWPGALLALLLFLLTVIGMRALALRLYLGIALAASLLAAQALTLARPPAPASASQRLERALLLNSYYADSAYLEAVRTLARLSQHDGTTE